ncbi:transcription intermediary factor 1-beta-like [Mercenaria mercenaria]|uniref:transcription intermediary factor 1-beta-like n=1 Tax=Mercenaria mercenaria TaxID=6596 RepID=UPI00234E4D10|nr:transcription intermediary factor 1-beta-like [Mercenaria mercenaria]
MDSVKRKKRCVICQPCQEANTCTRTKADGLCQECKEYMCRTCFHHHLKAKYCRAHVLLDLSEAEHTNTSREDVEKCEKHKNETVRFYCRKHDQVGCGDCMLFDGHGTCHLEYIKDISVNFRNGEEFKHLTEKLETLESDNNSIHINIQKSIKGNNEMNAKLIGYVKTFRKSINSYLDEAQANCLSYANKLHSEKDDLLKKKEAGCQGIVSEIEGHKQKLDSEHNPDRVLFIHSVVVKSKLQLIEDAINKNRFSNEIDNIAFKPCEELCEIVTKSNSFGCFEQVPPRESSISSGIPVNTANRVIVKRTSTTTACKDANLASVKNQNTYQNVKETSGDFWIFVELQSPRQTKAYFVDPCEPISALKARIHHKEGISVDIQRVKLKLAFLGKLLDDTRSIMDYGIQRGNTLNCFWRLDKPSEEATS